MSCLTSESMYATAKLASPESMSENPAAEVRAINGLIVGLLDNIDDFRRAIFALEQHVSLLQRGLYSRVQAVADLQERVRAIGGEPATTRSTLATAFAKLVAVREPFAKNHREEVLRDVDRGEQAVKHLFQQCLASERWFGPGKQCVHEVLDAIMSDRCRNGESWSPQKALAAAPDVSRMSMNAWLAAT